MLPICTPQRSTELEVVWGLVSTFVMIMVHLLMQLSITSCLLKLTLFWHVCRNSHVSTKQSNTEQFKFVSIIPYASAIATCQLNRIKKYIAESHQEADYLTICFFYFLS